MSLKKVLIGVLIILVIIIGIGFAVVNSWTNTEHGKLDLKVAIILKVLDLTMDDPMQKGLSPQEVREFVNALSLKSRGAPIDFPNIKNIDIPGPSGRIPVRIYTPEGKDKYPVIIYYHGGGWVLGNLDTHDNICRNLAKKSSCIVVSVDYRLAPEHKYPAAVNDAYAALRWVSKNAEKIKGDSSRIAVAGDSAGGNLAAVVSLKARDQNGPKIAYQVLIYPGINLYEQNTPSFKYFAEGYYLSKKHIDWFLLQYVPNKKDRKSPYASPLFAKDLSNLPPALVITAQFDVLRDEGEAYAQRLKKSGVPTIQSRYKGVIHSFAVMEMLSQSKDAVDEISSVLRKAFDE